MVFFGDQQPAAPHGGRWRVSLPDALANIDQDSPTTPPKPLDAMDSFVLDSMDDPSSYFTSTPQDLLPFDLLGDDLQADAFSQHIRTAAPVPSSFPNMGIPGQQFRVQQHSRHHLHQQQQQQQQSPLLQRNIRHPQTSIPQHLSLSYSGSHASNYSATNTPSLDGSFQLNNVLSGGPARKPLQNMSTSSFDHKAYRSLLPSLDEYRSAAHVNTASLDDSLATAFQNQMSFGGESLSPTKEIELDTVFQFDFSEGDHNHATGIGLGAATESGSDGSPQRPSSLTSATYIQPMGMLSGNQALQQQQRSILSANASVFVSSSSASSSPQPIPKVRHPASSPIGIVSPTIASGGGGTTPPNNLLYSAPWPQSEATSPIGTGGHAGNASRFLSPPNSGFNNQFLMPQPINARQYAPPSSHHRHLLGQQQKQQPQQMQSSFGLISSSAPTTSFSQFLPQSPNSTTSPVAHNQQMRSTSVVSASQPFTESSDAADIGSGVVSTAEDGCPVIKVPRRNYLGYDGVITVPHRKWKNGGIANPDHRHFMVMSYNLLAPNYCTSTKFQQVDPRFLDWEYRRSKILDEIAFHSPDFVCMQELPPLDYYKFFGPELHKLGYDGLFQLKKREHAADGCAIFYHTRRFMMVAMQAFVYAEQLGADASPDLKERLSSHGNVALVGIFQNMSARHLRVRVVTTHLHWDPTCADVKLLQAAILMGWLEKSAAGTTPFSTNNSMGSTTVLPSTSAPSATTVPSLINIGGQPSMSYRDIPTVIAADLNSRPGEPVMDFLVRGKVGVGEVFSEKDFGRFGAGWSKEELERILESWHKQQALQQQLHEQQQLILSAASRTSAVEESHAVAAAAEAVSASEMANEGLLKQNEVGNATGWGSPPSLAAPWGSPPPPTRSQSISFASAVAGHGHDSNKSPTGSTTFAGWAVPSSPSAQTGHNLASSASPTASDSVHHFAPPQQLSYLPHHPPPHLLPPLLRHATKLASAYDRRDLPYTNKTSDFAGTIDHILYTSGTLSIRDVLVGVDPPVPRESAEKREAREARERSLAAAHAQAAAAAAAIANGGVVPDMHPATQTTTSTTEVSIATPDVETKKEPPSTWLSRLESLPQEHFPSDHLSLVAWLKWKTVPVVGNAQQQQQQALQLIPANGSTRMVALGTSPPGTRTIATRDRRGSASGSSFERTARSPGASGVGLPSTPRRSRRR